MSHAPTAENEPDTPGPTGASTARVAGRRTRGAAVLFATVLAAVGLVFGAGAAVSAPVGTSETAVEEAGVDEKTVASHRAQARHLRARTRRHRRERLRRSRRRRSLALLSPLVAAIRCIPRRGPPLLTD